MASTEEEEEEESLFKIHFVTPQWLSAYSFLTAALPFLINELCSHQDDNLQ